MRILCGALIVLLVLLAGIVISRAGDEEESLLDIYLERTDPNFSEETHMVGGVFGGPGYHSTVPRGTWAHQTRGSLNYAVALLERNAPGDAQRAAKVIAKVLTLQDTDPESHTYGIWPWLLEEPLEEMAPPDWNWADFLGAKLAQMLVDYPHLLADALKEDMRASLGHAAEAIRRRDVGPGYTNIAIMGGVVCVAAGELLGDEEMLRYGRQRLQRVVEHTEHHGSFNEYNSPTYTRVALWEVERALQLLEDPRSREAAETLRRVGWEIVAESFHPGTQQWAGPHSRVYSNLLRPSLVGYLSGETGVAIEPHPSLEDADPTRGFEVLQHLACPDDLVDRFRALPADPHQVVRTFIRSRTPGASTIGTTWFTAEATLGSVNRSNLWVQRRPLLGYWKTEADPAVVFRVRFLHDESDFASMGIVTDQEGGRALSLFHPLRNHGSWHPSLDRPEGGIFTASDFRVRYELSGRGVAVEEGGGGRFALSAGGHRVVLHTLPGRFDGEEIRWQSGRSGDSVFVDGVCYAGPPRDFDFATLPEVVLAAGIELIADDEAPAAARPLLFEDEGRVEATWEVAEGLAVGYGPH